jgi:hypothetical protein
MWRIKVRHDQEEPSNIHIVEFGRTDRKVKAAKRQTQSGFWKAFET